MYFSERELSPELSSSAESSVEFVAAIPGPDCEEQSSTIILTDSEDSPPKPKNSSPSISCLLVKILCALGLERTWSFTQGRKSKWTKRKHAHRGAGWQLTYGEDVEQLVAQWIMEARDLQLPGQWKMIQRKGAALIALDHPNFRASDGWLQKFKLHLRRHIHPAEASCWPGENLKKLIYTVKPWRERHNFLMSWSSILMKHPYTLTCFGQVQSWRRVPKKFVFEAPRVKRNV